jgi:hypothetical protein
LGVGSSLGCGFADVSGWAAGGAGSGDAAGSGVGSSLGSGSAGAPGSTVGGAGSGDVAGAGVGRGVGSSLGSGSAGPPGSAAGASAETGRCMGGVQKDSPSNSTVITSQAAPALGHWRSPRSGSAGGRPTISTTLPAPLFPAWTSRPAQIAKVRNM